jgi:hypothetical protein
MYEVEVASSSITFIPVPQSIGSNSERDTHAQTVITKAYSSSLKKEG